MMKPCEPFPISDYEVKMAGAMWALEPYAARQALVEQRARCKHYEDDIHLAIILPKRYPIDYQMVVRRKDQNKIGDHWKTLQRIKNEVLGEHYYGYEVYPPEVLVVDTWHSYHLWCTEHQLFPTYVIEQAIRLKQACQDKQKNG